jgi:hypothetical protein
VVPAAFFVGVQRNQSKMTYRLVKGFFVISDCFRCLFVIRGVMCFNLYITPSEKKTLPVATDRRREQNRSWDRYAARLTSGKRTDLTGAERESTTGARTTATRRL